MGLFTAQVFIVQVCSSIEEIYSLSIIVEVFMFHTEVVKSYDHSSIDVFLISGELKFVTEWGLLVGKV
jgi:hypothetical protein